MATTGGNAYLVSMLGENCHWVKNVRAADGEVIIHHGRARACRLIEVAVDERAPLIKLYLKQVPGARPHIPVDRHAGLEEFVKVAANTPVFRVTKSRE
jgi:hypothetical protein